MMAGRVVAALCHGAFFGIGAVLAADLVAPAKRGGAIATMFAGLTIANVLGVPLGTLLGQHFGWRSTFWAITGVGIVALLGIAALVPAQHGASRPRTGLREEFAAFCNAQVWLSLAVTVLGFGGMFGAFTYIAYTLTEVSGFAAASVPALLVVFGAGLFAGNLLGGRAADRSVARTLAVTLGSLVVVLVLFALTAGSQAATVAALFLMGAAGFAAVPAMQTRVLHFASAAPTLASGTNIAAFNVGNALGAWAGGVTIGAGLGFRSPLWTGAAISLAGLLVLAYATRLTTRHPVTATAPTSATAPSAATATVATTTTPAALNPHERPADVRPAASRPAAVTPGCSV
jgi:DHA1 family inner membrane transport protein